MPHHRLLRLVLCLVLLLPTLPAVAQTQDVPLPRAAAAEQPTATEAQADFDLMRRALEEAHTGLYRYSTKAQLDKLFTEKRAKLNRPIGRMAFLTLLSETIAQVRCGHTNIFPDFDTDKAMRSAPLFPLQVVLEKRGLLVAANNTASDPTIRPGMEILAINGRSAPEILAHMGPIVHGDGDVETPKPAIIGRRFREYFYLFVEESREFTIRARDETGRIVTAKLAGVTPAEQAKNQNLVNAVVRAGDDKLNGWARENLSLRFLQDSDIAQIRIKGFGGNDFPKWMAATFQTLHEKKTKTLIMDLRGNSGGEDMYGAMLVSYLTDKPCRYFERIRMKTFTVSFAQHSDWETQEAQLKRELREESVLTTPDPAGGYLLTARLHRGLAAQPPAKHPFLGKVFVLTDGGTFSTAADICAVVHHLKRATFIGEETGGGYAGNNSGLETIVTLPHSKMRVRIPLWEYWNAVDNVRNKRHGTRPDFAVETGLTDRMGGVDAPLERALKLSGDTPKTRPAVLP